MTDSPGPHPLTAGRSERLAELADLDDGWLDGIGRKPTDAALTATRAALTQLPADVQDKVALVPAEDGGVAFEWRGGTWMLIADVAPDGQFDWSLVNTLSGKSVDGADGADAATVVDRIRTYAHPASPTGGI